MPEATLYGYWRSSATYRVRIALNLKGIVYTRAGVDLVAGEQFAEEHRQRHPAARVPVLEIDGVRIGQSMAIIDYLDETRPDPPFLPSGAAARAQIRDFVGQIVADIHPLNNTGPLAQLRELFGADAGQLLTWRKTWIMRGFAVLEQLVSPAGSTCFGDAVTLADIVLAPQMANARRDGFDLSAFPRLCRIEQALLEHPAFFSASPQAQPEAVPA
jgi:maleylacetoacetate isomerase